MPAIASSAPAVLLAHLAANTSTIRVGSGGVMLPNHAPLVVAEQFGTLAALHPGRIDLGIGRAPGTDQATALALRRTVEGLSAEQFPQELASLINFFTEDDPGRSSPHPGAGLKPDVWLLGSSGYSAQLAGLLGLPFAFAHHFSAAEHAPGAGALPGPVPAVALARRAVRDGRGLHGVRRHRRAGPLPDGAGRAVVPAAAPGPPAAAGHARRRRPPTRTPRWSGSSWPTAWSVRRSARPRPSRSSSPRCWRRPRRTS